MKKRLSLSKRSVITLATSISLILSLLIPALLIYSGEWLLNAPYAKRYEIHGVDVSSYQGEINWDVLAEQNIAFAFIKATEGSTLTDPKFAYNLSEAKRQNIAVGAYHFFSYDTPAETQANNFIETVTAFEGMLPPVIDLELYGNYEKEPPTREYVDEQLGIMITLLEEHYRLKPIIYATEKSYELFLSEDYKEYDIWIRNVYSTPTLLDGRTWAFWQYTNRAKLDGYSGREKYIDLNVFCGNAEEFRLYPRYSTN